MREERATGGIRTHDIHLFGRRLPRWRSSH